MKYIVIDIVEPHEFGDANVALRILHMIASYFEWQLYIRKCDMFRFVWIVVCFRRLPWAW